MSLTIEQWQAQLPDMKPTENMMRWMSKFDHVCKKACCFSPLCGCIRCTNCRISFTANDIPKVRYQCMICPLVLTGPSSRPELCETCFRSDAKALHDHDLFCKVDEQGNHFVAVRAKVVPRQELSTTDFWPAVTDQEACAVCCDPFSRTKPAVSPAGCKRGHGESKPDPLLGVCDSGVFYCADCALSFEQSRDRGTYCDLTTYCKCCQHENDLRSWQQEFRELFLNGDPNTVREDMLRLHIQPWLQEIIEHEWQIRMDEANASRST